MRLRHLAFVLFVAACGETYGEATTEPIATLPIDSKTDRDGIAGDQDVLVGMPGVPAVDAATDTTIDAPIDSAVACTSKKYDEGLSTILRGIFVGGGYQRISEWRVAGSPNEKAIVIANCGAADYDRCDALSFSHFAIDQYTSGVVKVDARDDHGHRLEYHLSYSDAASCWDVVYARLDEKAVTLLTQTYGSGELNTCGATGEPTFSVDSCPL